MNILLVGEYSRLHNSLKEGLQKLGHQVVICGLGDGFKDFPVDFPVYKRWDSGWRKKVKLALYHVLGFDLSSWLTYRQFLKYNEQLCGFDVVQLINESSFLCDVKTEKRILSHIFANNPNVFLLSCGNDYLNVKYNLEHPEFKSVLQPYLAGKVSAKDFQSALKFQKTVFAQLHDYIFENIIGVIASDLDYVPALQNHQKFLGLIPNPVNVDKISFEKIVLNDKIEIFLGINNDSYYKKGSDIFEHAVQIIQKKYGPRVSIVVTRSIPYDLYIQTYNQSHILLDQTYSIDQGYNALEAMAKGKIVFTGAEEGFVDYYKIDLPVNLNAKADINYIVAELSKLIENPHEIELIATRARQFIEREHHYVNIAQHYIDIWQSAIKKG